jgi:DNA-binding transcriptional regulator YdaS (Cro superfamily)
MISLSMSGFGCDGQIIGQQIVGCQQLFIGGCWRRSSVHNLTRQLFVATFQGMLPQSQVIAKAIEAAGGAEAVAAALGMRSSEGVRLWRVRGKVPDKRVVDLERLSGVPREKLRPDLFRPVPRLKK